MSDVEYLLRALGDLTKQVKRIADFLEGGGTPPFPLEELENLNLFELLKPKDE
tara:strand:+ start:249 stop:407 length:159 start_codon:yes stop_codon:yes gene_type:complete